MLDAVHSAEQSDLVNAVRRERIYLPVGVHRYGNDRFFERRELFRSGVGFHFVKYEIRRGVVVKLVSERIETACFIVAVIDGGNDRFVVEYVTAHFGAATTVTILESGLANSRSRIAEAEPIYGRNRGRGTDNVTFTVRHTLFADLNHARSAYRFLKDGIALDNSARINLLFHARRHCRAV